MKLNKNQLSVVKYIIKEEIEKFQKKTLLESKKSNTISELRQIIRESLESLDEKAISEGWNLPPGVSDNDPHFNYDDDVEHTVEDVEDDGYDEDDYPKYDFTTNYGGGIVDCNTILFKGSGWSFIHGGESKNPSIVGLVDNLYNKLEDYYASMPSVKNGGEITEEEWKKVKDYQKKLYSHKLATKIIETEFGKSLKDVIQDLIDSGKINVDMNEPDFYNPYD